MNAAPRRFLNAALGLSLLVTMQAAISTDSPFVPKNGQVMAVPTENTPIELRGVMSAPDGQYFAIYEPATQKGDWVKMGQSDASYVVRSYDEANASITVEYQGRVQTLVLKEARFDGTAMVLPTVTQAQPGMPIPGAQPRPPMPGGMPVAANVANPAEEAARLQQVANEVKRRRAARAAAAQASAAPQMSAPGSP
jgi:hypothetical protein